MATFNASHHESGGVVLFSGELILLYCDNVNITFETKSQNANGRLYLTTHRIVFTSQPINQNSSLKSFSAPFYAMSDLSLEQPVFGANFIKGKVRPESQPDAPNGVVFKLKFSHGGAIEFGQALDSAAKQANIAAREMQFQPPPPYTAAAGQYYQAPPNVYQPAYNCGFALPTQVFSTPPPAGFIYAMEAPPPYPGLNTAPQNYAPYSQMAFPAYGQYDPRMDGGQGGFLKDWTLFAYARHWLGDNVKAKYGSYDNEKLRFSAFSFQEINCITYAEDLHRTCYRSAIMWDRLTVMFDNKTAVPVYYNQTIEWDQSGQNPLGFAEHQHFRNTDKFLPELNRNTMDVEVVSDLANREFVAALFDNKNDILYLGLKYIDPDTTRKRADRYCITHLNMRTMIHNVNEWPRDKDVKRLWQKGFCFSGSLIGMFMKGDKKYIAGQVAYIGRDYEDQVWQMSHNGGTKDIGIERRTLGDYALTLKTMFGCPPVAPPKRTKRSIKSDYFESDFPEVGKPQMVMSEDVPQRDHFIGK
ncbi:unnamed protein product [Oppiella nova]|uniref:GRAM domain-containing protein n=1 Tax=Oppiella nova TaxID=334625 RepID=A0A7R9LH29_9ACAR|nr:unnamed protein product [Oppiella nova]CAG2162882.1 unnamed protein product [Oppiella nova]